nr:hypothetical protein [Haloarchaeobius sp. FL176]
MLCQRTLRATHQPPTTNRPLPTRLEPPAGLHVPQLGPAGDDAAGRRARPRQAADGLVRGAEFGPIHEWMTDHVHRHGQRYEPAELVAVATGEPLTAEYFVDCAREKAEALYGL